MGSDTNKEKQTPLLPSTKAELAEGRLEELVKNRSVRLYYLSFNTSYYYITVDYNDCRLYPDGFEAVVRGSDKKVSWEGLLYVTRRNVFVHYSLEIEREKQSEQESTLK